MFRVMITTVKLETIQMSINSRMDEDSVAYSYKRNAIQRCK